MKLITYEIEGKEVIFLQPHQMNAAGIKTNCSQCPWRWELNEARGMDSMCPRDGRGKMLCAGGFFVEDTPEVRAAMAIAVMENSG